MDFFNYLAMIMIVSCTSIVQEEVKVSSVSFESATRGGYKSITMYERKVIINTNHSAESFLLKAGDLDQFSAVISELELTSLGSYHVPNQDRHRDAAWHSNIVVYSEDSISYQSQTFDNDQAPAELQELMELFTDISIKYNRGKKLF
jgi:hypothetical protein